ncbi:MAG: bis(5'-nucleosyl)-tetraphosphatase [Acholeplasmataceae bacterium]
MRKERSCGTVTYHLIDDFNIVFLLIKQHNTYHWGFPKGHQEIKETDAMTALRETKEETGLDVSIYHHIKSYVTYHPKSNIEKTVIYYLAESQSQEVNIQIDKVIDFKWATYDEVLSILTYENDKILFRALYEKAIEKRVFINPQLKDYMTHDVISAYDQLDQAHQRDHVLKVIDEALTMAKHFDVYYDMIYVIACYHDLGMLHGRDDHHITGGNMLKDDHHLKRWFSDEEIYIMAQAVKDHRASKLEPPQTIYGQIIAQADRDLDLNDILKRIVLYAKSNHPNISFTHFFPEGYKHLKEKYGKNGYMALLIKTDETIKKVAKLQALIEDESRIYQQFYTLFQTL